MIGLTLKQQARYRAITYQLAKMREKGWDRNSHPDFELLEEEQEALGKKMTEGQDQK